MKTRYLIILGVVGALAFAAAPLSIDTIGRWVQGPLYVAPKSIGATSTNAVTRMLAGSETVDFASATITCVDSTGHTVTGAQVGDGCIVGAPAAATANANFTCYVSAADTVKVRFCPAGTAANPAEATYKTRLISNQ